MGKIFLLSMLSVWSLSACTGILLKADNGEVVNGRTLEFGVPVTTTVAVIPRGYSFTGKTPEGTGLVYTAKYAAVGCYAYNDPVLMDGINEKGLVAAAFYFPGFAGYTPITKENQGKAVSPNEFPNWILTQFATIEEVKAGLNSVVIAPTIVENWGPETPPFHYIVYDTKGNGLVIEPIDGKFKIYDNKIGAFTNSPTFDWHMNNLRNFINLTPVNQSPITIRGVELSSFGMGSGMVGIPGDFTPPSRFVRAAIFSTTAIPSKTGDEAVGQAFHILNQFDIPVGVAVSGEHTDATQLTTVKDQNKLRYYFKSYLDQTIQWVDLKAVPLDGKTIVSAPTQGKVTMFNITDTLTERRYSN